jgi:hypothetical protein
MIRKLALVLAAALCGTGYALIFGSVSQIPNTMLVAAGIVITAGGVHGAWRGTGRVARGERAPRLAWVGAAAAVVGLVGLPLVWGRVSPELMAGYLLVLAAAAIFVPIGLTGDTAAATTRAVDRPLDEQGGERSATLKVSRPHDAGGLLRRLHVTVDGRHVAALRPGHGVTVTVPAGRRTIQARMDWIASRPLTVKIEEGSTAVVEASVPGRAYWQTWWNPSEALDVRIHDWTDAAPLKTDEA